MDLSFVSGWMVGVPLLIFVAMLVWALLDASRTSPFDAEEHWWTIAQDDGDKPYDWKEEGL